MIMELEGKVVLITGCNVGIGKETVLDLSKRGARIIMAYRNIESAEKAKLSIISKSNNSNIIVKKLDLSSLQSVKDFANDINQTEEKIDILINNAGVMAIPLSLTENGFEKQFAVNHLGHFLLTKLLLKLLKNAESARVVVVASKIAKLGAIDFEDLHYKHRSYTPYSAYAQSKLANILFVSELSRRLEGTNVTVYSVHPGVVKSDLYRNQWRITKALMWPGRIFMKTPEQGAATTLYCATEKNIEQYSGRYFAGSKLASLPRKCLDQDVARRLWEVSEKMVSV